MTTKAGILQAIRQKCLDCCCQQPKEVRACPVTACGLWPYRLGRDPDRSRSRGFAKPSLYTEDSSQRRSRMGPDTALTEGLAESSVYTSDFSEREPV